MIPKHCFVTAFLAKTNNVTVIANADRAERKLCASLLKTSIIAPKFRHNIEGGQFSRGQAKILYKVLTCPKDLIVFTAGESSEEHCQEVAHTRGHQKILDWLDRFCAGMDK